jgi:hypothetical protein
MHLLNMRDALVCSLSNHERAAALAVFMEKSDGRSRNNGKDWRDVPRERDLAIARLTFDNRADCKRKCVSTSQWKSLHLEADSKSVIRARKGASRAFSPAVAKKLTKGLRRSRAKILFHS